MNGMGAHSHPNGHRGDDGSMATLEPLAISTALSPQRLVPFALSPQQGSATATGEGRVSRWCRVAVAHRAWLAAVPVVLVNAVAFGAQLGFWGAHLRVLAQAVLVALALESIANYLAWQSHLAQLADDSALRLRLAAYGVAVIIGALNYSHFDGPGWRPTVPAVTFGMMSAISPWLWSVHSRRVSRDKLKERGLIEPHAVRLGATRWAWHPWRSARVMWHATWLGVNDPTVAIALATPAAPDLSPVGDGDEGEELRDERHDDQDDSDKDSDTDSDTNPPPPPPPPNPNRSDAGDKVRAVLKSSRRLRADLLGTDPAKRKAAKTAVAAKAGVSERTVERVMREVAAASPGAR